MGLTQSLKTGYLASPSLVVVRDETEGCVRCTGNNSSDPGNPGSFQDIHKKVKDLYPQNFEGATLKVSRKLSNHFRVDHTLTLSPVTPSGYKFGAFYEGTTMIGRSERYPSLSCIVTPSGNQTIKFANTLGCRYRLMLEGQIADSKYKVYSSTLDYRSDNCTLSMRLDNPNLFDLNGTLVIHFLQAVSSGLALGVEMACHRDPRFSGQKTILSGAARYSTGQFTISSTVGEAGVHVCCHRRASENLQIGTEIDVNLRTHESQGTLVYQLNAPRANFTFRGMIDSECSVSGVLDKKLSSIIESSLLISGTLNHKKRQFRVGVGLNVGL